MGERRGEKGKGEKEQVEEKEKGTYYNTWIDSKFERKSLLVCLFFFSFSLLRNKKEGKMIKEKERKKEKEKRKRKRKRETSSNEKM